MASFECKYLEIQREGAFVTVYLNRPEVRNAFNADLIQDLQRMAEWVEEQEDIRAVFLEGKGPIFCSGGDLNWMGDSLSWGEQENIADSKRLSAMFTALNQLSKPLIGFVHGGAYGGGVGLVSVCDHVVSEGKSIFSLSEVRLGLIPACIGPFVLQKIGIGHARSLFISGQRFKAPKALAIGLIHDVVADRDGWNEIKQDMMKTFSKVGPHAVKTAKHFLREIRTKDFSEANDLAAITLAELRVGEEAQEGIKAFLDKRKPNWDASKS